MQYKSKVWWPKDAGLSLGNTECTSEDFHGSEEEAKSVCDTLMVKGFGCIGEIHPLKAEVYFGDKAIYCVIK